MTETSQTEAVPAGPPRKRKKETLVVINMPPPWQRSLTESGMKRVTTSVDVLAVVVFVVGIVAFALFIAYVA
jgi:hypothetical protein